jgi:hypothetical protein
MSEIKTGLNTFWKVQATSARRKSILVTAKINKILLDIMQTC